MAAGTPWTCEDCHIYTLLNYCPYLYTAQFNWPDSQSVYTCLCRSRIISGQLEAMSIISVWPQHQNTDPNGRRLLSSKSDLPGRQLTSKEQRRKSLDDQDIIDMTPQQCILRIHSDVQTHESMHKYPKLIISTVQFPKHQLMTSSLTIIMHRTKHIFQKVCN